MSAANAGTATRIRTIALVVFSAVLIAGLVLVGGRAGAAWERVTETGQPGNLQLRSDPWPAEWYDVRAGEVITWGIEASLTDATRSTLALELEASGTLVDAGLRVSVESCTVAHIGIYCPGIAESIVHDTELATLPPNADERTWQLAELAADAPRYLLVTVAVPAHLADGALEGRIGVGLHASGIDGGPESGADGNDDGAQDGGDGGTPGGGDSGVGVGAEGDAAPDGQADDELAATGADIAALLVLAIGMTGLGVLLLGGRKTKRASEVES